jgi:adenosylhomocysteine nucleosidase
MKHPYLKYRSTFLENISQVKNLLVIVAMESEEKALLSGIVTNEITYGSKIKTIARQFKLPKCHVTVARSGVGLVKAGILLTTIAENQTIDAVILLGVGGALDESLSVGDTVIANQIIQHDSVASGSESTHFMAPGELTLSSPPDQQVDPVMRCDSILVDWIKSAIVTSHSGKIFTGTILSGSEFAASAERKKALRALASDALLVDMEAAALAQISRMMQIPFVAAKTVADRANPETSISDDYKTFLTAATSHSSGVLQALLRTFS